MAEVWLAWTPAAPEEGSARARWLLRRLYETVAGGDMPLLTKEPGGKPVFASGPWHLSISHSKQAAFCALSLLPVGLDAEHLSRRISPGLAERSLHPRELIRFRQQGGDSRLFLTHWVLKEAWGKWTGLGLTPRRLRELCFCLERPETPVLEGSPLCFLTRELAGHMVALCAEEPVELRFPAFSPETR